MLTQNMVTDYGNETGQGREYYELQKGDISRFTNESGETVTFDGMEYQPGDELAIVLNRDWNMMEEGLGEGGPWGWGGFTSELILSLMRRYAD